MKWVIAWSFLASLHLGYLIIVLLAGNVLMSVMQALAVSIWTINAALAYGEITR